MTRKIISASKKRLILAVIIIAVILAAYNIWAELYRAREKKTGWVRDPVMQVRFEEINIGHDSGKGNLIGIQPFLIPQYYSTALNFRVSLLFYLNQLKRDGLLNNGTIVIFPEHVGSGLVALNEKESMYDEPDVRSAVANMIRSNIFKFLYRYMKAPAGVGRIGQALFTMKGKHMADVYQQSVAVLAKEVDISIVAGSIILPDPFIDSLGMLRAGKGPLRNVSVVFGKNGAIIPPIVKNIFPAGFGKGFISAGRLNEATPVFNTRAGKLGVLIAADSWYPDSYDSLANMADLLAIPAHGGLDSSWGRPWRGCYGEVLPRDFDSADLGKISAETAWAKYGIGARAPKAGIHYGMNVFFTGNMWNLQAEGRVFVLKKDSLQVLAPAKERGRIVNLWLN